MNLMHMCGTTAIRSGRRIVCLVHGECASDEIWCCCPACNQPINPFRRKRWKKKPGEFNHASGCPREEQSNDRR